MELVSIITPSYKSEPFIEDCIKSVIDQTYTNWEMLIVDDASPDYSNQIIEKYIKIDSRIKLIKLENNSGPARARNLAIENSNGRYIAFLDSDDLWLNNKLEKQINFLQEHNLVMTYSSYHLNNEENKELGVFITKDIISYNEILKTNCIGCLTAIYDTKKIGKVYMPNILKRQDYGLWLIILKKIDFTKGILEPTAVYRIRKNSVSSNKFKSLLYVWTIYRDFEKLSFLKSCYYFCYYILNGLRKYK